MKFVFVSNYYNHHQQFISDELFIQNNITYYFLETQHISRDRIDLGWAQNYQKSYIKRMYVSSKDKLEGNDLIDNADIVMVGSAPENLIKERIHRGKLIFRYSERPLKSGNNPLKYFPRLMLWRKRSPKNKPIYMLCASAYTALDYSRFGLFKNKTYKWGYFPETKIYDIDTLMKSKEKKRILWCGRFIDWKHPDDALNLALRLKNFGYSFEMGFIGTGNMECELKRIVREKELDDFVVFYGSMKPEQVREHMENAGIYIFTSDKKEGWGAVLNESMNSGCAVVASHTIGSVPYLINNGSNGLIYRSGDIGMLFEKVKYLLDNPNIQEKLGRAAYNTIVNEWNAEVAASRVVNLAEHILNGEQSPNLYSSGPCSKAEILKESWFRG